MAIQDKFNRPNVIYKITKDIDLGGETLTIPEGCTLDFQGGSFSNGTLKGNNTSIQASITKIYGLDIELIGTWNVSEAYPEWFGAKGDGITDDTEPLQQCFDLSKKIILNNKNKYKSKTLYLNNDIDIEGNGATIIHSENSDLHQGLIYVLKDFKFSAKNVVFDGNEPNLSDDWTALYYNFIWCAVGSLHLDNCIVKNSRGHAIRTGNVDMTNLGLFDPDQFAHDIIIENCIVEQSRNEGHCGDCLRIERTKNVFIHNNKVYGGYSGIRCQCFGKDLTITNNVVRDSVRDVGITAAMFENVFISSNECSGHYQHGIEIDAVVDCNVSNNYLHDNMKSGIFCTCYNTGSTPYEWARGVISEKYADKGFGYQEYGALDLPNLNTQISNNICVNNGESDALIGQDGIIYSGNYVDNPVKSNINQYFQLNISGGTINKTKCYIYNNYFKCSPTDIYAIHTSGYQFDAVGSGNKTNANRLSLYPIFGECELIKSGCRTLEDVGIINRFAEYVDDEKALNKKSWKYLLPYNYTFVNSCLKILNSGYKFISVRLRAITTVSIKIQLNQYNDSEFVKTILNNSVSVSEEFSEVKTFFNFDTSKGNKLFIQFEIPGNTEIRVEDISVYGTSELDGYPIRMNGFAEGRYKGELAVSSQNTFPNSFDGLVNGQTRFDIESKKLVTFYDNAWYYPNGAIAKQY